MGRFENYAKGQRILSLASGVNVKVSDLISLRKWCHLPRWRALEVKHAEMEWKAMQTKSSFWLCLVFGPTKHLRGDIL